MLYTRIISKKVSLFAVCFMLGIAAWQGCVSPPEAAVECVRAHQVTDPIQLCPLSAVDNGASTIMNNIFQSLIAIDYKTYQITPVLAQSRPVVENLENGKMAVSFEIRAEAKWDNGKPITGYDVLFSLKTLRVPRADNKALAGEFQDVEDVRIDISNPKKFSVIFKQPYMMAEQAFEDLLIIPRYVYDTEAILEKFTYAQLTQPSEVLKNDVFLTRWADAYNSNLFRRERVIGSGAYSFTRWETGKRITLNRKAKWWADSIPQNTGARSNWLEAVPKQLVFETISDMTAAIVSLKSDIIQVMAHIDPKVFTQELAKNVDFTSKYVLYTPTLPAFSYMPINTKNPKFSDVRTRQALAHLMDVDQYIQTVSYGMGARAISFIPPGLDKFRNNDLQPYTYDIDKAKDLLTEVGWKDTNNNGTLDKIINGVATEFYITINYNTDNKKREKACLIFQDACRKVGIKVTIEGVEIAKFSEKLHHHQFEMAVSALTQSAPIEDDPYQLWHSRSFLEGGTNFSGFGDAASDAIIDAIRREMDEDKRIVLQKKLQLMVYQSVPVIFLMNNKNAIAINKNYANAEESNCQPGYWIAGFGSSKMQFSGQ
jgi:peptide/nickel transport system substrate-binding protein